METILVERESTATLNNFAANGYAVIELPPLSEEVHASFGRMPRDGHSLKRLREIRLSQFFGYWEEGQWIFALLPRRKYIQSAEYIRLAEAGGVFRHREQMEVDPSSIISCVLDNLQVDRSKNYHVNVNQIRVVANAEFKGVTVPEGPHRDGHQFSVIGIAQRRNVEGGETQVIDPETREVVFRTTLKENQAILLDDERYIHTATDINTVEGGTGYRDIWVIEINQWEKRAYGPRHEKLASAATLEE